MFCYLSSFIFKLPGFVVGYLSFGEISIIISFRVFFCPPIPFLFPSFLICFWYSYLYLCCYCSTFFWTLFFTFFFSLAFQTLKFLLTYLQDHWFFACLNLVYWWTQKGILSLTVFFISNISFWWFLRNFHFSAYSTRLFLHVVYFFHKSP